MTYSEAKAICELFTYNHKAYNIKHSDGLELAIEILLNELEKKDAIINEMTNCIRVITVDMKISIGENLLWNDNEIKQYFEGRVKNDRRRREGY